jgi:predicted TPR repeat methyltransferase
MCLLLPETDRNWREALQSINPGLGHLAPSIGSAQTLALYGKPAESEQVYREMLAHGRDAKVLRAYAGLLRRLGRNVEAYDCRREAVRLEVADLGLDSAEQAETIRFRLAREGLAEAPDRAPQSYVARIFDEYASEFDEHLVNVLGYRTPALLSAALRSAGALEHGKNIFDGGCGTGLMGEQLSEYAKHMVGCDISRGMIEKAMSKSIYSALYVGDIASVLEQLNQRFDMLLCADVFPYMGDLRPIFSSFTHYSTDDAYCAFSTEHFDGRGYHLHARGRYGHSETYLRDLADHHGWTILHHSMEPLRYETRRPVMGNVMVWRRA